MLRLYFSLFTILFSLPGFSQNIVGNWEGSLQVQGNEIPIVFHISSDSAGKFTATFDSPKQKAFNLACSDVIIKEDSVILMMQILKGRYSGKLNENKKQLTGTWYQSGTSFPLIMHKTGDMVTTKIINRPQTPKLPFPYKSEGVEYDNADKSIHFGGTFTVPFPDSNVQHIKSPAYPVVILITGSGKQDRDETIFDHKPFAVIADYLTRQGIAVLRVDDRGTGKTTGDFRKSTTADFAKDVETGIGYLKSRKDIDIGNIGLIGHSEGGMIAPMVAVKRNDIRFIVLLAGPGVKISQLMEQQSADVMLASGISKEDVQQYRPLYKNLITAVINEKDTTEAIQKAAEVFKKWQTGKSESTVKNTTGVKDERSLSAFIDAFVKQLNEPWFRYFMNFNPADYLSKLNCPVLALNGEKDIQVAAKENLNAIKSALEKNKNKNFKIQEMEGLNHLFQHCKKCSVDEYGDLEESFDTETLKIITTWIKTERFK